MVRQATAATGAGVWREFDHLGTELDQHVLTLTPNHPEVRNALHGPAYRALFATDDHREGIRAFLEKRDPRPDGT